MGLRSARTVVGRAVALLTAGLVVAILGATVILPLLVGGSTYTILTGSMEPAMPPGTVVVDRPEPASQIRAGDVITYQLRSGDPTVATHRVVSAGIALDGSYRFITKGDANSAPDPNVVLPEQIKGVRWYAIKYLGYPALKAGGDFRRLVVSFAVVALLGYAVASFAGAIRDRRRSKAAKAVVVTEDRPIESELTSTGATR